MKEGLRPRGRHCRYLVAVALASAGLVAGCGSSGDSDNAKDDSKSTDAKTSEKFALGVSYDLGNLDPHAGEDVSTQMLFHNIAQTLVEPDFEGNTPKTKPMLAKSFTQDDDTTWTFKLQDGVKFSNGEVFDAEAAKSSIERYLDPATQSAHASFLKVKTMTVVDPTTLEIKTDGPSPDLTRALYDVAMVPPKAVKDDPEGFTKKPIGTGPYVVSEATPDRLTMTINPDYWNKANATPRAKTITVEPRPEAATRVAAVQAGEVDVVNSVPLESIEQLPAAPHVPANENLQLRLNATDGVFQDAKMREAVLIGTDTEKIRTSLYTDEHSRAPQCQHAPPQAFGFNPDLQPAAIDTDKAKTLIKEAGYNGEKVTIIGAQGHYPKGDEAVQAIEGEWKELGLNVELKILPTDAWIKPLFGEERGGETVHKGHDAIIVGLSAFALTAIEPMQTAVDQGAQLETFPHDDNPEVQPLLDKAREELDPDKQEALLKELGEKICASNGFMFIANYDAIWGTKEGVDFKPRPDARVILDTPKS